MPLLLIHYLSTISFYFWNYNSSPTFLRSCPNWNTGILSFPINQSPFRTFPGGSDGKGSACNEGDLGSIPGLGRSPEEGNANSLQYSCLENSMGRGVWQATVQGVTKSWIQLSFLPKKCNVAQFVVLLSVFAFLFFFFSGPYVLPLQIDGEEKLMKKRDQIHI